MELSKMTDKELVAWFDSQSVKPFDPVFGGEGTLGPIAGILDQNRDMEPFVIQSAAFPTPFLRKRQGFPLQFIHLSDIHACLELWDRMTEYLEHYDTISFALHTGDYCGDNQLQHRDLYAQGRKTGKPIFNCVGNHDTITGSDWHKTAKDVPHRLLFNHADHWDAVFMDRPCSMSYYRDFPEADLRLIVLDQYYDLSQQENWLEATLEDAKEKGLWVATATHEPTGPIAAPLTVAFHTLLDYRQPEECVFDGILGEFIRSGGQFVCNFCGHEHHDLFGYTSNGVLNVAVECACDWAGWSDGRRVRGTRTYDCFNVVTVDTWEGLLKLVRIGDPCDCFLRPRGYLCYDLRKRRVIANG